VLCPALSFFATAESILRAGLRPIFVDVVPETGLLCPEAARTHAGEALAAVVVHLYGRCVDLPALDLGDLPIVEDAAQAIGAQDARGRRAGALGRLGTFSFFPTKNLGALGDGGLVCTSERGLGAPLRELRQHGLREGSFHRLGGNFRLDALQAAFLRVKLPHLPAWNRMRAAHALAYDRDLAELPLHRPPLQDGMAWHHYIIQHPERNRLRADLAAQGVETGLYYARPMPLEPALAQMGHRPGDFPGAEAFCTRALALPVHPTLREDQRQRVVDALRHSLR
jgi:dTDP-4-amino-4,6-dideoxygalactose transaminase